MSKPSSTVVVPPKPGLPLVRPKGAAVVLVHGLFSSAKVWTPLLSLLCSDKSIDSHFDWIPYQYSSPHLECNPLRRVPDFDTLAAGLTTYVDERLPNYKRLIFITHSQGGLVVQRYLAKMLADGRGLDLMRIRRIILFACPNNGSELAISLRKAAWFWRHAQERQLRPAAADIASVRQRIFQAIVNAPSAAPDRCPIPIAAYAGESDNVVGKDSAIGDFAISGALPGDHSTIVEPKDRGAVAYRTIRRGLIAGLRESVPRVSDWQVKAEQLIASVRDEVHPRFSSPEIEIPVAGAATPIRVVVRAGGMDNLDCVDVVVSSENIYFEMAKPFKPSTSGRLRSAAAIKNPLGEIVEDVMFNELNAWLRTNCKHGIQVPIGTVAPTGPGQLSLRNIKRVYHAAIVSPKPGSNEYDVPPNAIPIAISNIFTLARHERASGFALQSIALPLFGAGRGGNNPDDSFRQIWEALKTEHAQDSSWEIHLCTWKIYETELVVHRLAQLAAGLEALSDEPDSL